MIQVRLTLQFDYQTWQLGAFNAGIGIAFALAMYLNTNFFVKRFSQHFMVLSTLFLTTICLFFVSILKYHIDILVFSLIGSGIDMIAYSAMITAFSDSVSAYKQGWVMGIFGASTAIAWSLSGFSTNFLSLMSVEMVLFIGAIFMLIAAIFMTMYIKKYPRPYESLK